MEKGAIYTGKAPEPTRKIALGTDPNAPGTEIKLPMITEEGVHVGADTIHAIPTPKPTFSETPGPKDPERAVAQATTEDRIGELTRAIGDLKRQNELTVQEMQLRHESEIAALGGQVGNQPDPASYLPSGVNPEQPIKAGEFMVMLQKLMPYFDEKITRSGWDVTPEEETAVLAANPHFNNITDGGKRIECILKAVQLRRQRNGNSGPSKTTSAASSTPQISGESASRTRRQARTVPHIEGSTSPVAPDLAPENLTGDYMRRYEEAKNIPNKTLRLQTMKKIYKESLASQGITDEALAKSKFAHSV